jgi:glycerol-3-phosphate dehydrogenase (NAD(P)+)
LPGADFPAALTVESDLSTALQDSRDVLVAVPSHAFRDTLALIAPKLRRATRVA